MTTDPHPAAPGDPDRPEPGPAADTAPDDPSPLPPPDAADAPGPRGAGQHVPGPQPGQRQGQQPGEEFFGRIRRLGIVRPDEDRWAAGVCAALARRTGLDPLLVRGLFIALTLIGGFGVGLYGLGWLLLPHPDGRIHAEAVLHGVVTAGFIGSLLCILSNLGWLNGRWPGWGGWPWAPPAGLVFTALLAVGIWWLVTRGAALPPRTAGPGQGRPGPGPGYGWPAPGSPVPPAGTPGQDAPGAAAPAYGTPGYGTAGYAAPGPGVTARTSQWPGGVGSAEYSGSRYPRGGGAGRAPAPAPAWPPGAPPRPADPHAPSHALTRATLGLALVAAAVVLLWHRVGGPPHAHPAVVALAVALGVVALGVVVAGLLGRRPGGLAPMAILLAAAAVTGAVVGSTTMAVGTHTWRPTSLAAAELGYDLGAGNATIDLTDPALIAALRGTTPLTVPVHVGLGRLRVILPATTGAQVRASVGAGNIRARIDPAGSPRSADAAGTGLSRTVTSGSGPALVVVTASVGVGDLEIDTQTAGVTS